MAITKVLRLVLSQTYGGTILCMNALHFASEDGSPSSAAVLAAQFASVFITSGGVAQPWRANVHQVMAFNNLEVNSLYPDALDNAVVGLGGVIGVFSGTYNLGGAIAVQTIPPAPVQTAGILTWRTGIPGRSWRGRSYIAGLPYLIGGTSWASAIAPSSDIVWAGVTAVGGRDCLNRIGNQFKAKFWKGGLTNIGDYYLCHVSTKLAGKVAPINLAGVVPTADYSVPNYWATMGSRRGGRGL